MGRPPESGSRRTPRWLVLAPAGVLLVYGLLPLLAPSFREDEVHCEEAKAHLLDCCDPFTGSLECEYISGACSTKYPDLSVSESRALQKRSCAELKASGTCEKHFGEAP